MTTELQERVEAAEEGTRPEPARPGEMFRYSAWVHVGPGAADCDGVPRDDEGNEIAGEVNCGMEEHFHAWVRLPNKLQHRDLHERAAAAAARRRRELRDTESNAYAVLEDELDEIRTHASVDAMVEELMEGEWGQDYLQAIDDVKADEEWEYIDRDRERYQVLFTEEDGDNTPEDEWSEELKSLHGRIEKYIAATKARLVRIQDPKREALAARGKDGLIDELRKKRIDAAATRVHIHVFNVHQWVMCTYAHRPFRNKKPKPVWDSMAAMEDEAPEVVERVEETFNDLALALQQGVAEGNS